MSKDITRIVDCLACKQINYSPNFSVPSYGPLTYNPAPLPERPIRLGVIPDYEMSDRSNAKTMLKVGSESVNIQVMRTPPLHWNDVSFNIKAQSIGKDVEEKKVVNEISMKDIFDDSSYNSSSDSLVTLHHKVAITVGPESYVLLGKRLLTTKEAENIFNILESDKTIRQQQYD